ncbi:MAG: glycosyltransferase family 2 protein [Candidatus Rokuibacteriota bacterium]
MKACLLIPIYNHRARIGDVLRSLAGAGLAGLVVDDGSDAETRDTLTRLAADLPWVGVERLPENRGRGAALRHGYEWALRRGFSHAIQLDADGQHDAGDVPRFLEAARRAPDALVLGAPVFDASAPWARRYGRRISTFWVRVETLSNAIGDPLCGYRCVPVAHAVRLLRRAPLGDRMEFDPELVVRWWWAGLPVTHVPTRVRYFSDGLSHFHPLWDNFRISRAHVRLFLGMLPRVPRLCRRPGGAR